MLPACLIRPCAFAGVRHFATLNELAAKSKPAPQDLYEPKIEVKKVYPEYSKINLRLRGYDYVVLEKYQSFAHKMANVFRFNVSDSYATAASTHRAINYKPRTATIESECDFAIYERTVQLADVPAVQLQLLLDVLRTHLPPGVELSAKENTKEDEDAKYIPDLMLKEKQEELKALSDPTVRKNLGWE